MLRCASPFVVAAYAKVRLTPQGSRALPADFLRSHPKYKAFATFYEIALLADAEICEDPLEDVLRGCAAGDLAEGVQRFADLQGGQLGRKAAPQAVPGADETLRRLLQGDLVAEGGGQRLRALLQRAKP